MRKEREGKKRRKERGKNLFVHLPNVKKQGLRRNLHSSIDVVLYDSAAKATY